MGDLTEDPPDEDLAPLMSGPFLDQNMAQQAAAEFQNMLQQLVEVQKVVLQRTQEDGDGSPGEMPPVNSIAGEGLGAGVPGGALPDDSMMGAEAFGPALLQDLEHLAEKAQHVAVDA